MSAVASSGFPHRVCPRCYRVAAVSALASLHEIAAAEQKRWMTWFGLPALCAAIFVGVRHSGPNQEWYLGLAIAAIIVDIGVLIWLTMSSDTNGVIGAPAASHH